MKFNRLAAASLAFVLATACNEDDATAATVVETTQVAEAVEVADETRAQVADVEPDINKTMSDAIAKADSAGAVRLLISYSSTFSFSVPQVSRLVKKIDDSDDAGIILASGVKLAGPQAKVLLKVIADANDIVAMRTVLACERGISASYTRLFEEKVGTSAEVGDPELGDIDAEDPADTEDEGYVRERYNANDIYQAIDALKVEGELSSDQIKDHVAVALADSRLDLDDIEEIFVTGRNINSSQQRALISRIEQLLEGEGTLNFEKFSIALFSILEKGALNSHSIDKILKIIPRMECDEAYTYRERYCGDNFSGVLISEKELTEAQVTQMIAQIVRKEDVVTAIRVLGSERKLTTKQSVTLIRLKIKGDIEDDAL